MRVVYFEFSNLIVELGVMPSTLCYVIGREHDSRMFRVLQFAERAYYCEENKQIEIKNRRCEPGTTYISDEDRVVLKLKAVLI